MLDSGHNMHVDVLTKEEWAEYAERAHLVVFSELKPSGYDYIDFALVVRQEQKLMGYLTCRKLDDTSVYWQYGGAFPGTRGSSMTLTVYLKLVWWAKQNFKSIQTLIDNHNVTMLKMAMKVGFRITGIKTHGGRILLEHTMEWT